MVYTRLKSFDGRTYAYTEKKDEQRRTRITEYLGRATEKQLNRYGHKSFPFKEWLKGKRKNVILPPKKIKEQLPRTKILNLIKKFDEGQGADLTKIFKKSGFEKKETENMIINLLREGEIFEIKRGFLRIL